ncbi:DUF1120 domain-containing protein [Burkholderia sp. SCN-KJ]|uniref:DUF1120 domain-containing protein n=1 Tax=Burkholderia sp. SCN-KJ TaxID=2969248 RepID=UPI00214FAAF7|nr:DUF1120 domain-containing protein [Burkholderia sp. SCN-KJ]MCR4465548.1 DUF1120 domain-containing protein [Burkholderia sp. SCN-KJ]
MSLKQWCGVSMLACALSSPGVASAADLSVSGQIRADSACSIALGNGGVVDLGTISSRNLQEADETNFNSNMPFGVHCQAPTKVAFRLLDNRAGTSSYHNMFGLGASGGKNVGAVVLALDEIFGDGAKLTHLAHWKGGSGWGEGWGDIKAEDVLLSSWAEPGQSSPQAYQNIDSSLRFYTRIAPAKDLDLSQEIAIDGSITMELVYL